MSDSIRVTCLRPDSDFDTSPDCYQRREHMLGNAIILPPDLFEEMGVEPFCYIRARYGEDEEGKVIYAIPFSSDYDAAENAIAISTNLMKEIDPNLGVRDEIQIEPVNAPCSDPLTVHRPYSDPHDGVCYLDPKVLSDIDVESGEQIEIYNTETGGRVTLIADTLFKNDQSLKKIRLDLHSTEILDINFDDTVRVRAAVEIEHASKSSYLTNTIKMLKNSILDYFVGSRQVLLRVKPGLDQDEYRGIIRVNRSTMGYLGVEEKDRIMLKWKGRETSVQCLPKSDDTTEPLTVLVPSTVRDQIEVSNFDGVSVWRDRWYIFQKRIAISFLGILGVVFGTFQITTATSISEVLIDEVGVIGNLLVLLSLSAVLSIPVIWFLLLPVRSEVQD